MGQALAHETSEANQILDKLMARANVAEDREALYQRVDPVALKLDGFVVQSQTIQLLGAFQTQWQIHPNHWRMTRASVLRGMDVKTLSKLCTQLLRAIGRLVSVERIMWTASDWDPCCHREILRLGHHMKASNPTLSRLLQSLELLQHPQECSCTGIHVWGVHVTWVSTRTLGFTNDIAIYLRLTVS
jgi:hypothetical protein